MDMANTSIDDDNEGVPGPGFEPGAEHLETVRAPDIEDEGEAAPDDLRAVGEDGHAIRPEPEMMDLAAFKALFRHIWNIPGMMVANLKPLGITSDKAEACDECATATYELAARYFPGMLRNDNETAGAIMRMLPFLLMQAGAVNAIMADRRAERAAMAGQAANTNAAPQFKSRRAGPNPQTKPAGAYDWMDDEKGDRPMMGAPKFPQYKTVPTFAV